MKYCESCAERHIVKEATVRMTWDLGEKWICEDCAFEIMGKLVGDDHDHQHRDHNEVLRVRSSHD